jgi:murein L,D-transpeptidase YafK
MKLRILALMLFGLAGLALGFAFISPLSEQEPSLVLPRIEHIVVEKAARRMLLYSGGKLAHTLNNIQLGDVPVGHKRFEGDERTPEGHYTIDSRNPRSAFHLSLHISYPRSQDTDFAAKQGRSPGGQVFIHGQPNWLPGGRLRGDWTNGCIAVSNVEIEALWKSVRNGTSIEIVP